MCSSPFELRLQIGSDQKLHVILEDGSEAVLPLRRDPVMSQAPNSLPGNTGLLFSNAEQAILKAATFEWQTAPEIAEKTGHTASTWFRAILSNLVERKWLEGGRNGYRRKNGLDYPF